LVSLTFDHIGRSAPFGLPVWAKFVQQAITWSLMFCSAGVKVNPAVL
jgi:hypothetical protein